MIPLGIWTLFGSASQNIHQRWWWCVIRHLRPCRHHILSLLFFMTGLDRYRWYNSVIPRLYRPRGVDMFITEKKKGEEGIAILPCHRTEHALSFCFLLNAQIRLGVWRMIFFSKGVVLVPLPLLLWSLTLHERKEEDDKMVQSIITITLIRHLL